jgi:hypothetical protein
MPREGSIGATPSLRQLDDSRSSTALARTPSPPRSERIPGDVTGIEAWGSISRIPRSISRRPTSPRRRPEAHCPSRYGMGPSGNGNEVLVVAHAVPIDSMSPVVVRWGGMVRHVCGHCAQLSPARRKRWRPPTFPGMPELGVSQRTAHEEPRGTPMSNGFGPPSASLPPARPFAHSQLVMMVATDGQHRDSHPWNGGSTSSLLLIDYQRCMQKLGGSRPVADVRRGMRPAPNNPRTVSRLWPAHQPADR